MRAKQISKDIYIGSNILNILNDFIEDFDKILIFSNNTVADIYFEKLKENFKNNDKFFYFTVKDGEKYKSIDTVIPVYDYMIENNFSRKSLLISLGGGVVCDMGGYIAATYMRGIEFIQVPTSLLAQVDASVGGKVAINHSNCKNMIGVFKQPYKVLIDVEFLKTLNEKEFRSGMGELLKHSFINKDNDYIDFIKKNADKIKKYDSEILIKIIEKSILIKKYYVDIDPYEKKERAFLNLGHTYAHTLESFFKYEGISHGEAVAKGIIFDLELAFLRNKISIFFLENSKKIFEIFDIDSELTYIPENKIFKFMLKDKKNSFNNITTIEIDEEKNLSKTIIKKEEILKIMDKYKNNYLRASIDIGTNSCRLAIAEIKKLDTELKLKKIIYKDLEIVKLGEEVNKNKFLLESSINRTVLCLKKYKKIIDDFGIKNENIICFATSATRDSTNKDYFIEKVNRDVGLKINCISGKEEAYINFKGVSSAIIFNNENENVLVFDIGGGSTEFTLGNKNGILESISIDIGSVRITEKFLLKDGVYDYSQKNIENAKKWVVNELLKLKNFKNYNFKLIGVAGTITTQISVRDKMLKYDSDKIHLSVLREDELNNNMELYLNSIPKNLEIIGLDSKRKNVIIGGSIILKTILEVLSKKECQVSEYDNLIGAILGGLNV